MFLVYSNTNATNVCKLSLDYKGSSFGDLCISQLLVCLCMEDD